MKTGLGELTHSSKLLRSASWEVDPGMALSPCSSPPPTVTTLGSGPCWPRPWPPGTAHSVPIGSDYQKVLLPLNSYLATGRFCQLVLVLLSGATQ